MNSEGSTNEKIAKLSKQIEEMRLKNEELLKLNAEKDEFFIIIAHDLRSPFNSFLGITELMAEELPSLTMKDIQKFVVSMRHSAVNLFHLLENLLHWARMQQGFIPFNPADIQLHPIVHESIELEKEHAEKKEIEIIYEISDDITVFAEYNMLQAIVRNLFSNAVKFTPHGGRISISAKETDDDSIKISIKNTGSGMSSAIIDNLFRIDVKINKSGTDGESGSGFGLLLCKEFVKKHGGKIWVESKEGEDTVFHFTIPNRKAD